MDQRASLRHRPLRRGSVLIAAILAASLAISMLWAASASAVPRTFYGITVDGTPTSSQWSKLGAAGAGSARVNLIWGNVQPSPGVWDWAYFDSIVGQAALNGSEVLPVLYGIISWGTPSSEYPPRGGVLAQWRAFAQAASARYGTRGTFWSSFPGPKVPVTYWQIWNEPNSESFWKPFPNPREYMGVLRTARAGLKSGDPRAKIVLAGFFPTPNTKNGIWLKRYLPQIYRSAKKGKARKLFDVMTVHPYSLQPKHMIPTIRDVRRIMARYKDKKKQIWVTEIGWASGGAPTPLTVGLARQADYLRQTYAIAKANRKKLKIKRVYWFLLQDTPDPIWYKNSGLLNVDGSPKPSWGAFAAAAGGTP